MKDVSNVWKGQYNQMTFLSLTLRLPVTLSVSLSSIGESARTGGIVKVVGGGNATEGEFPFMISLQMKPSFGSQYHYCGGSILNATHVISSASCVESRNQRQIEVVAGAHNLTNYNEPSVQRRSIQSIIFHPQFDPRHLVNNIALLTLNQSLQLTPQVQPMPLPSLPLEYTGNCTALGWGSTLDSPTPPSHHLLQKLNMTLVPLLTCRSIYEFIVDIDSNGTMLCAKGTQDELSQGPCRGDLGGPLLCPQQNSSVVAGLFSWSMIPCGNSGYPSVFTNISTLSALTFI